MYYGDTYIVCPSVSAHVEAVKRLSSDDSKITDRERRHARGFLVHASGDLHKANKVLVDLLVLYPLGKWATYTEFVPVCVIVHVYAVAYR